MSGFNFQGVTWNGLTVTRHVPGHRHVTVRCQNPKCGVEFHVPVARVRYAQQNCPSCARTKPLVDTNDPTLERRAINQQIQDERQEAERRQREAEEAREKEAQRQRDLVAQTEADAVATRKARLEAEQFRREAEAREQAFRKQQADREAAEAQERAAIAQREARISEIVQDLSAAETIEARHIIIGWGRSPADVKAWEQAASTVRYARQQRQQQ